MLSCWFHVFTKREAWGLICRKSPEHNHAFLLFVQEDQAKANHLLEEEPEPPKEVPHYMAITNEKEGYDEGRKMGIALAALMGGPNPAVDARALNYLARKFSQWEGLQNVGVALSYVDGFIVGTTQGDTSRQIGAPRGE